MGGLPVQRDTDKDCSIEQPCRLYGRHACNVAELHLYASCTAGVYVHLQRMGSLPARRHADQDRNIEQPCGMHGYTVIVADLHLCSASDDADDALADS